MKAHIMFWGGAFAAFFGFIWLFSGVLTPFVLGIAIAYLLNPVVTWFAQHGLARWISALWILTMFMLFVLCLLLVIGPPAYREASILIKNFPDYMDILMTRIEPYLVMVQDRLGDGYIENLRETLKNNAGKLLQVGGGLLGGLASGGQAVIGFTTTIVLTPLVAFFMMMEWPKITQWVQDLYPRQYDMTIRDLFKQMDQKLAGFVRGQISIAVVLGLIYATALSIAGLNFGFLIGLCAGLLSIVPLVGSTLGLLVSVVVAWFQTGELTYVGIIAAIFLVGQIVEGNILTPKLMGDSVGLHPLWIMFALMAGGSLFGILGMLLAVPVASVIGVLLSFAIVQYKSSSLYQKPEPQKKKPAKSSKAKSNG